MKRPLIVLDTETAALHGAPHLIELGAVRVVDGEAVDHFQSLVRPQVPIEEGAGEVHGITDEEVRNAPAAAEVLTRFAVWAGDHWLAAHNARFDARVLGFEYARADLTPPPGPIVDSLALARRHLPEAPDHTLLTLAEYLELEVDEIHRALPDAVLAWQVIDACVERLGGWDAVGDAQLLGHGGLPHGIRSSTPVSPRRSPAQVRQLEMARRAGTPVRLLYGTKGEPPARLQVLPTLLYQEKGRAYLEAECAASGLLKTYRLDRVHRVEAD